MVKKNPKEKKNKLPSGNVRVQVYDYIDTDGKKHYKSFTAANKKLAKAAANEWKVNKDKDKPTPENLTVHDAITQYMNIKKGVLSPATLRGYTGMQKIYFSGNFGLTKLPDLNNATIQLWVSDLSSKVSPKTVSNAYGLLSATLDMFAPESNFKIKLPQKQKPDLYCPNDNDIKRLLDYISGTELEIAVLFAAFGPLRRGEICALDGDKDISGNTIQVRHSMVKGPDKQWYIKEPKTPESSRELEMPEFVIDRVRERHGAIVHMNPDYITHRFGRVLKKLNIPHFRFHDLRHYSVSIMHAIGTPDAYIMRRGGWKTDTVMKVTYRNVIDLETAKQNKKINSYFEKVSHEVSHEARKA